MWSSNPIGREKQPAPLRFYSGLGFIAVLIAAVLLSVFVRKLAIDEYVAFAQSNNVNLTQAALRTVRSELLRYLALVQDVKPGDAVRQQLSPALLSSISELMQDRSVVKVEIFNRAGTVVFSTDHAEIGQAHQYNGGFESAINGNVASRLNYRDTFNIFESEDRDENLMSTYVPIRGLPGEPIHGVFEIYIDANSLVHRNERTQLRILLGVGLILAFLYLILILMARRAGRGVALQQRAIRDRSAILEMLFAENLTSEELEKRKTAAELHEGLAQTLCAIKVGLENTTGRIPGGGKAAGEIDPIMLMLQRAIEQARSIAIGLRPLSLDGLGLLRTIDWYCRSFESQHPQIRVEQSIALQESDIVAPLKIVIYRIVELALGNIARSENADRVQLTFRRADGSVILEIEETARDSVYATASDNREPDLYLRFAGISERTTLSGGVFFIKRNASGGVTLRASWPCIPVDEGSV